MSDPQHEEVVLRRLWRALAIVGVLVVGAIPLITATNAQRSADRAGQAVVALQAANKKLRAQDRRQRHLASDNRQAFCAYSRVVADATVEQKAHESTAKFNKHIADFEVIVQRAHRLHCKKVGLPQFFYLDQTMVPQGAINRAVKEQGIPFSSPNTNPPGHRRRRPSSSTPAPSGSTGTCLLQLCIPTLPSLP